MDIKIVYILCLNEKPVSAHRTKRSASERKAQLKKDGFKKVTIIDVFYYPTNN